MKPRLFWTMLLAFVLVIVLGVAGMLGFFGLAVAGIWQPAAPQAPQTGQRIYVEALGDYYVAHGNSWAGVDQRLASLPFAGPVSFRSYALVDTSGRIVATNDSELESGQLIKPDLLDSGTPVTARGQRVGTLILTRPAWNAKPGLADGHGPPDFLWPVLRGFVFAGLALGGTLLALAAFFAQRLSHPLRGMSAAAQALAAGQLDIQVPGARVRELDDLAHSFNAMARALHQADRQRRQMTADIAHELRTPLSIIKGRLEGLQDGVYRATPEEIERLLGETALLERLIDDLRLLALAEAGQLQLYTEALDPRDLLQDAAHAFAVQADAQGVALRVAAPDDLPAVEVDPQRMAQVFANLVANALRYTPPGGSITLSAELLRDDERPRTSDHSKSRPSTVVFRVCDTGHGIAADELPYVFDRFYRADRSRARSSGGAGLGLAIAKQIVAAHGGTIWAESELGRGTTICVGLPLAAVAAQSDTSVARGA
jgi:signal transduction histidine kinase